MPPVLRLEVLAAQPALDHDLPPARDAEDERVVGGFNDLAGRLGQTARAAPPSTRAGANRAAASRAIAEMLLELGATHPVEIVGHLDLSSHESGTQARQMRRGFVGPDDLLGRVDSVHLT